MSDTGNSKGGKQPGKLDESRPKADRSEPAPAKPMHGEPTHNAPPAQAPRKDRAQSTMEPPVTISGPGVKKKHVELGAKPKGFVKIKVTLLDATAIELNVAKRVKGKDIVDSICKELDLIETDYFGVRYKDTRDSQEEMNWIDPQKEVRKQIRDHPWEFYFKVKFYPPDPSQLMEDSTRYQLCLQLRQNIQEGKFPCLQKKQELLALLEFYVVQSELGDHDSKKHGNNTAYLEPFNFAPSGTLPGDKKKLEEKVLELHKTQKGRTPIKANLHFLEQAKQLDMYGVDLHRARNTEGADIKVGVCAEGLLFYRDWLGIGRHAWAKILWISYRRNNFYYRPEESSKITVRYELANDRAAKRLWKSCVEHHTFFRLVTPERPTKLPMIHLGSKFKYPGRTLYMITGVQTTTDTQTTTDREMQTTPTIESTSVPTTKGVLTTIATGVQATQTTNSTGVQTIKCVQTTTATGVQATPTTTSTGVRTITDMQTKGVQATPTTESIGVPETIDELPDIISWEESNGYVTYYEVRPPMSSGRVSGKRYEVTVRTGGKKRVYETTEREVKSPNSEYVKRIMEAAYDLFIESQKWSSKGNDSIADAVKNIALLMAEMSKYVGGEGGSKESNEGLKDCGEKIKKVSDVVTATEIAGQCTDKISTGSMELMQHCLLKLHLLVDEMKINSGKHKPDPVQLSLNAQKLTELLVQLRYNVIQPELERKLSLRGAKNSFRQATL